MASNGINAAIEALPVTGETKAGNPKRTGVIGNYWVMAVPKRAEKPKANGNGKPKATQKQVSDLKALAAELGLTVS